GRHGDAPQEEDAPRPAEPGGLDGEPVHQRLPGLPDHRPRGQLRRLRDGQYSFFNQGVPIFATNAFEADNPPGLALHDLLTIFLSTAGSGGIDHVVNGTGGSSTIANPDTPVNVVSYP